MIQLFFTILLSLFFANSNLEGMNVRHILPEWYDFLDQQGKMIPNDRLPTFTCVHIRGIHNYATRHLIAEAESSEKIRKCSINRQSILLSGCYTQVGINLITINKYKTNIRIPFNNHRLLISCQEDMPTTVHISKSSFGRRCIETIGYDFKGIILDKVEEQLSKGVALKPDKGIALTGDLVIDGNGDAQFIDPQVVLLF